jgi:hypothetical protein
MIQNLRCLDQARSGATDATRTLRGIHAAGNRETAGQWLFRWAGIGSLQNRRLSLRWFEPNTCQAAGGTRNQWPDLLMPSGVIEHQQHFLTGWVVAPASGARLQSRRDRLGTDPGRQQQAGQRIGGIHWSLARRVRMQLAIRLPMVRSNCTSS